MRKSPLLNRVTKCRGVGTSGFVSYFVAPEFESCYGATFY
jgi:hypothetical protein